IYLIDCPGVVYPQGETETEIILKGIVRVENVKDPENHVQGVLDRVKKEHLEKTYKISGWDDVEEFMTKIAFASGRLLKGGEPDIPTIAKMVLNDFQRGRLPYYARPPGCDDEEIKKHEGDLAPINEVEEDEKANITDGESVAGSDNEDDESEGTKNKEVTIDDIPPKDEEESDEELTEIGSTCSGLTDMSGFSDLEMDFPDQEGTVDAGVDEGDKKPLNLLGKKTANSRKRPRGKRAGKKVKESENKKKVKPGLVHSIVDEAPTKKVEGVVDFGSKDKKMNMWFKKLAKRKKVKHQQ
uniref:Uncharacterized protein n=1 Tax=Panagrolaimus sp. ES5 TaxID=591445 RepID=A0AC34G213_9BILA